MLLIFNNSYPPINNGGSDAGLPVTLKLSFTTDYVVYFSNSFLIWDHGVESQQSADGRQEYTVDRGTHLLIITWANLEAPVILMCQSKHEAQWTFVQCQ